mgnify:FL=1
MTPDEEAKANRQGSLLFALGGREGLPLRAVRPMEHSCRRQLYHEKRSRDGRGTGETDGFLLGFGEFLPPSKRDLLSRQYGFAGDCTVFRLGPSLFCHGLRPRWGCCKIGFSVGAATCRPLSHRITHLILAFCSERQRAAGSRPYRFSILQQSLLFYDHRQNPCLADGRFGYMDERKTRKETNI